MTDLQTIAALAARVKTLEGPDREVDAAIADVTMPDLNLHRIGSDWCCRTPVYTGPVDISGYTASIDAASSLVPEGWYWMAGNRDRLTPRAYVENGKPAYVGIGTRRNPDRKWFEVTAPTPALALCAAALAALAEQRAGLS